VKINFSEIKSYIITLPENKEKIETTRQAMQSIGFNDPKIFLATKMNPGRTGLVKSFKNLFNLIKDHDEPILICEEDIEINPSYSLEAVDIPDDADALYIGISKWGRSSGINPYWDKNAESYIPNKQIFEGIVVKQVNSDIYRIYNMLSAHAVILINKEYTSFLNKAISFAEINGGHQDIVRSTTMPYWNIYALNNPIFYQRDLEQHTNFKISELESDRISYNLDII